jgi:hypothetical protein
MKLLSQLRQLLQRQLGFVRRQSPLISNAGDAKIEHHRSNVSGSHK